MSIGPGPTARKAWDAILTAGRFAGDVLAAPGKGAAATLRYVTTGEEPRLEQGSSWKIAGPGLGDMAAEGWALLGDEISKKLVPGTEGVDTSRGREAAANIMRIPFTTALEGIPESGLAQRGLAGLARWQTARTPLARAMPGVLEPNVPEAKSLGESVIAGGKAEYLMGRGLGDDIGRQMMVEGARGAVRGRNLIGIAEESLPGLQRAGRLDREAWRFNPQRWLAGYDYRLLGPFGQPTAGSRLGAATALGVGQELRRGLEERP